MEQITARELKELGLEAAANELEAKEALKKKLMVAYERFRFVSPAASRKVDGEELKKRVLLHLA